MENLTHQYNPGQNHDRVFVLLHGISEGLDSDFMQDIYTGLAGQNESVFAFNFPYLDRQENLNPEEKPTDSLEEECASLQQVTEHLRESGYKHISIIAKSLGGIVTSQWLQNHPEQKDLDVSILGYVVGDVNTSALKDHLKLVVQGEFDRFGNAHKVRAELKKSDVVASVIEVLNADHSYRNQARKPIYQKEAVKALLKNCL